MYVTSATRWHSSVPIDMIGEETDPYRVVHPDVIGLIPSSMRFAASGLGPAGGRSLGG